MTSANLTKVARFFAKFYYVPIIVVTLLWMLDVSVVLVNFIMGIYVALYAIIGFLMYKAK